jgi:16S rRNA (cytosine967-C5)-methyltransferase
MIAPARTAALEVLRAVNSRRSDLPSALARVRAHLPDERDRALAGEIATGTLRWQAAFDHVVSVFAGRPAAKLDPEVLDILRMTAFQLLHLARVPASAAVHDAVSLTRKVGKSSAAGLVNAVLRRISRERTKLPLPARTADSSAGALSYLSIALSHPEWLVGRWLARFGFDAAEAWARFNNEPAALTLRVNTLMTDRETLTKRLQEHDVRVEPARYAPDGLCVRSGNPLGTPLAAEGLFLVQDEASQLVALLTGVRPGERVLDACAAPGGKTTAMAAAMRNRGRIIATDVRGRRVDLLARTVRTSGATSVTVVQADASGTLPFHTSFDCVLLDAPCSGLGTIRRDPDIRWRRLETDLGALASTEGAMLDQAAAVVAPGGRLVYATCSSEPEENEEVVRRFLDRTPAFRAAAVELVPPSLRPFLDNEGYFRTLPFRDGLEAFFGAILVKTKDLR